MSTPDDRAEAKRLGEQRLAARRRHVWGLRKRVIATVISTFVLAFGVIFVQLVSGHDPVLTADKHNAKASSSSTSATSSRSGFPVGAGGSPESSSASTGSGQSAGSSVGTRQS